VVSYSGGIPIGPSGPFADQRLESSIPSSTTDHSSSSQSSSDS